MRVSALAFVAAIAASSVASADEDDDEDGEFVGFPRLSAAFAVTGHGTRIDARSETGFGPSVELALGRQRWQYFVEGGYATSSRAAAMPAMPDARVGGSVLRGGLGARWLARQFRPASQGAIELFVVSLVGVQRYVFEDLDRVTRPELALGIGTQVRSFRRPRLAFRLDARVLYTANQGDGMGFMSGAGFAW